MRLCEHAWFDFKNTFQIPMSTTLSAAETKAQRIKLLTQPRPLPRGGGELFCARPPAAHGVRSCSSETIVLAHVSQACDNITQLWLEKNLTQCYLGFDSTQTKQICEPEAERQEAM